VSRFQLSSLEEAIARANAPLPPTGKYQLDEGVICKGGTGGEDIWMVKIKTNAYMSKLKQAFAERWEDYWE
jgi:hypothetical protein